MNPQFYQTYLFYFLHSSGLLIFTVLEESRVMGDIAIEIQLLGRGEQERPRKRGRAT